MVCTGVQVAASFAAHELDLRGCCNNIILPSLVSCMNYKGNYKRKGNLLFVFILQMAQKGSVL